MNVVAEGFRVMKEEGVYRVLDWVLFSSGGSLHQHEYYFVGDRTLYEVYFYPTMRHNVKDFKDAVIVSYLTREEEKDPDYGYATMRLKMGQILEDLNIKGEKVAGGRKEAIFEVGDRQLVEVSRFEVETPKNIMFFNAYMNEVLDGRTKTLLLSEGILSGRDSADSKTTI